MKLHICWKSTFFLIATLCILFQEGHTQAQQTVSTVGRQSLTPQPLPEDLQPISYADAKRVNLWWSTKNFGTSPPLPPGAVAPDEDGVSLYYSPSSNAVFVDNQISDESLLQSGALLSSGTMDSLMDTSGEQAEFTTNDLWAQELAVTNDATFSTANLIIYPPQFEVGSVFDVFYTPSLQEPLQWYWVYRTIPWETNIWPGGLGLPSGYFKIADTNGPVDPTTGLTAACLGLVGPAALTNDLNGNGIPDLWEVTWLGGLHPADFSADGRSTIYDYSQASLDPNLISFNLLPFEDHTTNSTIAVGLNVLNGMAGSMAILVDDTNTADAVWLPFQTNVLINVGTSEGWHHLLIGARGRLESSLQTFQWTRVKIDRTPPLLVLTNAMPIPTDQAYIQIQGYSPEALSEITWSNAATGIQKAGFIVAQFYSTNTFELTTNWFQCFDVALTNGDNSLTISLVDLAGNTTVTNFVITYDPQSNTNAPEVVVTWPGNGTVLANSDLNCFGTVDNPSSTITAMLVDEAGITNTASAVVEADGHFWLDHMTLGQGANTLTITATSPAGVTNVTTLSVVHGPVDITVDAISADSFNQPPLYISGQLSASGYTVNVNGVDATPDPNDDTKWSAENVGLDSGTTAVITFRIAPQSQPLTVFKPMLSEASTSDSGDTSEEYTLVAERPPRLYAKQYYVNKTSDLFVAPGRTAPGEVPNSTSSEESWTDQQPGLGDGKIVYNNGSISTADQWPGAWWPNLGFGTEVTTATDPRLDRTNTMQPYVKFEHWAAKPQIRYDQYGAQNAWGFNDIRSADTRIGFFAGGRREAGKESLFEWSATMTDYGSDGLGTPTPVAPEDINIDDVGNLGTVGIRYSVIPEGAEIEPTAHGKGLKNVTFVVQPPPKYKVVIFRFGKEITDTNSTVVVGEGVTLSAHVWDEGFNEPKAPVQFQWTVPGSTVTNFYISPGATNGHPEPLTLTSNQTVHYYWYLGGKGLNVQCTAKVITNGVTTKVTGKTTFDVIRPTASWNAEINGVVSVDSDYDYPALHFGYNKSPDHKGMLFHYTNPQMNGYGGEYLFEWAQLADGYIRANLAGTNAGTVKILTGLDNAFPVALFPGVSGTDADSPGTGTSGRTKVYMSASFTSYLFFQPQTPADRIFVPTKKLTWNFSGTATNGQNGWVLLSDPNDVHITSNDVDAQEYPSWTSMATNAITISTNSF